MNVGPLRRITAAIGLIALVPITWLLIIGALTPEEAAIKAVIVVVVVVALGNVMRAVLTRLLHRVERRAGDQREVDEIRGQDVIGQAS
jgi:hypothetical protein